MKNDIASRVQYYTSLDTAAKSGETIPVAKPGSKGSSLSGSLTNLASSKLSLSSPSSSVKMVEVGKENAVKETAPPISGISTTAANYGSPSTTTTSTSAAAPKFGSPALGGGSNKLYAMEQQLYDGKAFHKGCLKCAHCHQTISLKNIAVLEGEIYCKPHFKQLFKLKGNYAEGFGKEDHKKNWSQPNA
ncbi:LIM domain and actin-binding protein 1 [Phlyctochytrium planicorne]|nr:LIM domain and actin-binding protein 1 [Phlyctochytrium planicorne]